jgi:hypothetical protein
MSFVPGFPKRIRPPAARAPYDSFGGDESLSRSCQLRVGIRQERVLGHRANLRGRTLSEVACALDPPGPTTTPVGGGEFLNVSDTEWGTFPGFVAFAFPESWLGERTRLALSLLTRQESNQRINQRFAGDEPTTGGRFGLETLYDQRMQETWGGLTLSRRIGERWASARRSTGSTAPSATAGSRTSSSLSPPARASPSS